MTNQEAFNTVVQHLRTQGEPSINPKNSRYIARCLYRHPDGIKRCAVGVLIPDELYQDDMECQSVYDLVTNGDLPFLSDLDINLLTNLQDAHDRNHETTEEWRLHMESEYKIIAHRYNLTIPTHPCAIDTSLEQSDRQSYTKRRVLTLPQNEPIFQPLPTL